MIVRRLNTAAIGLLVISLALTGCQKQTVRDDGDTSTGSLGSPLVGPSPADVYINLSAAYLQNGSLTEAYKNARKAVIVDPRSSNAHYMLALVQQRLGQLQEADASYRDAIKRDPHNPVALNAYGSFLCEQQRYADAEPFFERAVKNPLYGTPWLAWHNAGRCAELAGDKVKAESAYRRALQANPKFAPSLLGMAKVSYEDGNYLSSRAYLQRYAEVAQHTAESLWLGVLTENQLGDQDQKASYGLKLRSRFPDSEEAKYLQSIE